MRWPLGDNLFPHFGSWLRRGFGRPVRLGILGRGFRLGGSFHNWGRFGGLRMGRRRNSKQNKQDQAGDAHVRYPQ